MSQQSEEELDALELCTVALSTLEPAAQLRILNYLLARLENDDDGDDDDDDDDDDGRR